MTTLKYGNTNTYFIDGLLIDTDMAGTLGALFRTLKQNGLELKDIKYVLATHYHPDHTGLIGELTSLGVKLLLIDKQRDFVHFSDAVFARQKGIKYLPVCENEAAVISCAESRRFLADLGIVGEIIPTESHSPDGIALITDDGSCFVGDLEPLSFIDAYEDNVPLKKDWEGILSHKPKRVYFGHVNALIL